MILFLDLTSQKNQTSLNKNLGIVLVPRICDSCYFDAASWYSSSQDNLFRYTCMHIIPSIFTIYMLKNFFAFLNHIILLLGLSGALEVTLFMKSTQYANLTQNS